MRIWQHYAGFQLTYKDMIYCEIKFCGKKKHLIQWQQHKQHIDFIYCQVGNKNPQFLDHANTCTPTHSTQCMETTKARWPRSWHSALSSLYIDYIFMYSYFLGSPTGDSQNGASGVNFTEHGFLPDRGCSQPIFHRWSKQQSSERGSGDRCCADDSKIHRKNEKNKNTDRQWSTFNLCRCASAEAPSI